MGELGISTDAYGALAWVMLRRIDARAHCARSHGWLELMEWVRRREVRQRVGMKIRIGADAYSVRPRRLGHRVRPKVAQLSGLWLRKLKYAADARARYALARGFFFLNEYQKELITFPSFSKTLD